MALATAVNVPHFGTAFRDFNAHDDDDDDFDDYQSIPGSCIDATKLLSLLRMKFGAGTYDMHVSYTHTPSDAQTNTDNRCCRLCKTHTALLHHEDSLK